MRGNWGYVIVRVMVNIKGATRNAIAFAIDALGPERTQGVRLEEIESATEGSNDVWYITLSMVDPQENMVNSLAAAIGREARVYKRFTVNKETGEVTAMRIREVVNA